MSTKKIKSSNLLQQQGFSLIEVMIAIMLGLIIIAGVMKLFVTNHQTDVTNEALGQISENARYIVNRIGREARMAGYNGAMQRVPKNLLNDADNLAFDFEGLVIPGSSAVLGYEDVKAAAIPELKTYLQDEHGNEDPLPLDDTDVLILRTTYDMQAVALAGNTTTTTIPIVNNVISNRSCSTGVVSGICSGDILLISDYQKARIFQATTINLAGVITHLMGGSPGNTTDSWPVDASFDTNAEVIAYQTVGYYVAKEPISGEPGLYRKENNQPATLLVPNVANFQIEYAVDTNADRSVDEYRTAADVTDWANVLSINIVMLLAGQNAGAVDVPQMGLTFPDGVHVADDRRLYRTANFTVALRNRLQ